MHIRLSHLFQSMKELLDGFIFVERGNKISCVTLSAVACANVAQARLGITAQCPRQARRVMSPVFSESRRAWTLPWGSLSRRVPEAAAQHTALAALAPLSAYNCTINGVLLSAWMSYGD